MVTVAIPTCNRPTLLLETLDSVFRQTYKDPHIFISDNSDNDASERAVRELQKRHSNVLYKRHCPPIGHENWNYVISECRTAYVCFLHDDDLLLPHHLEQGMQALSQNAHAAFYASSVQMFGQGGHNRILVPAIGSRCSQITTFKPASDYISWLEGSTVMASSVILNRSAFDCMKIKATGLIGADWLWWGQLALAGDFIYNPQVGVLYRWHASNASNRTPKRRWACHSRFSQRTLARLALNQSVLDLERLEKSVISGWDAPTAAQLVLSLSSVDAPRRLRTVANNIVRERPDLFTEANVSRHFSIAQVVGWWYLSWADILDRLASRWWPPRVS